MIRFVDLTTWYWAAEDDEDNDPCCAFVDTITGKFVEKRTGGHVFHGLDEILELDAETADRFLPLVPDGFWR